MKTWPSLRGEVEPYKINSLTVFRTLLKCFKGRVELPVPAPANRHERGSFGSATASLVRAGWRGQEGRRFKLISAFSQNA
jgi:hypothetical protein